MKKRSLFMLLLIAVTLLGAMGAALRHWLFAVGTDSSGLLLTDHPSQILIWVLTVAVLLLLILASGKLKGSADYKSNFPASCPGAAGHVLAAGAAVSILLQTGLPGSDLLHIAGTVLGIASAVCFLVLAFLRLKGRQPIALFHIIICIWLMVELVLLYRTWSATPQLQNYCFSLLANVCIMLSVYYSATFTADMGNRQMHLIFHFLSVFFCLVSLPNSENPLFFALMAIFMLLDLCIPESLPEEV